MTTETVSIETLAGPETPDAVHAGPPRNQRGGGGESPAGEPVFVTAPPRHQHTAASALVALARGLPEDDLSAESIERRAVGTGWLLGYLEGFPGQTWQQRWDASPLCDADPVEVKTIVCAALGVKPTTASVYMVSGGLSVLLGLDVIRPRLDFVLRMRLSKLWTQLIRWREDPDGDLLSAAPGTEQRQSHARSALGRVLLLTGRPIGDLTAQDVLTYRQAVLARRVQSMGLTLLWECLRRRGQVEGTLYQALRPGRRTVTELVDQYPIRAQRVRGLLIMYLTERSHAVDYSTLRGLTQHLVHLFWVAVEDIAPGIDTLNLPTEVATAWKQQLRYRSTADGRELPRRTAFNTLMAVRGFYADLIQLAHDDPVRWAEWASSCPVSANEVKRYHKWRAQLRSEMHERTRERTVTITALADAAEQQHQQARRRYDAAHALAPGQTTTVNGTDFQRIDRAAHQLAHPRLQPLNPDGSRRDGPALDVIQDEEDTFWALATVEVLRHTGIRLQEMLALTQLDLHDYHHRDPEVGRVLLLHIGPSKQDQERMVVVAPELAAILAAIARRVRAAIGTTGTALPSTVIYDYADCQNSDPLPFFFQRTAGKGFKGASRPVSRKYINNVLSKVCAAAGLKTPDNRAINFTAHDFRRVFATDALAAGLPPHIIQNLLGHASITTTQDYAAIFPEDVIRSHRAFINNRRALRPADEYREVADAEWSEFEDHFAKRKIAIGDCMRAYGTNCVHEYACEQCQLARPDPSAKPRLQRIRDGLLEQTGEAQQRGWGGEVERLRYILSGVDDKLAQIDRNQRRATTVALGMPGWPAVLNS